MSEFDEDTAVTRVADNLWTGNLSPRWNIGNVPNGGYVMAVAGRVLGEALGHPEPLSVTAFYPEKIQAGEAEFRVDPIRAGNRMSFGAVQIVQQGSERVRVTAVYTDFDLIAGPEHIESPAPELPEPAQCVPVVALPFEIAERIEMRMSPAASRVWLDGERAEKAELLVWGRFRDGRDPDVLSLLAFADGFPPALFARFGVTGWVPTLELTVQVRGRPEPGPLLIRLRSRYLTGGLVEEDGEIWDAGGRLVALSRQLASFRLPRDAGTGPAVKG